MFMLVRIILGWRSHPPFTLARANAEAWQLEPRAAQEVVPVQAVPNETKNA
jgi:hypothetical protein